MSLPRDLRSRLLTLLLLLVGAVVLYAWARREDLLSRPAPTSGALYPGLDLSAVDWLHLGLRGGQDIELQRESSGAWWIVQPTREFAHQDRVAVLLDNIARAQVRALEAQAGPLSTRDVGLDPPVHVIAFRVAGRTETLSLGAVEALGREVYARRSGDDQVVLATRNLATLLEDNAGEWVDPALLRGLQGSVSALRIRGPDGTLSAERAGDGWALRAPEPCLADSDRLDQLVRTLQYAQAAHVLVPVPNATALHGAGLPTAEDVARGETQGATHIELQAAGVTAGAWLAADWRASAGDVAAVRDDFAKILLVPRGALSLLVNPPDWFRQHRVLAPVRERAEALRLERDGAPLLDIRRGAGTRWDFEAPARLAGEAVEAERIEGHSSLGEFLGRVDALAALGFAAPPAGDPAARLAVTWTFGGQTRQDRVDFFTVADRVLAVTSERPAEALELPPAALDLFAPITPDLLRSLRPLAVPLGQCAHIAIERPGSAAPIEVRRDPATDQWTGDDEWTRRSGLGSDMLRNLRGFRWVAARPGAKYGWRVRFEDAQGTLLADVRMRLPEAGESPESFGFPAVYAAIAGRDGVELLIHRDWVDRIEDLAGPLVRKP